MDDTKWVKKNINTERQVFKTKSFQNVMCIKPVITFSNSNTTVLLLVIHSGRHNLYQLYILTFALSSCFCCPANAGGVFKAGKKKKEQSITISMTSSILHLS